MEDDMLATPIGKIPPPMLQNNKDNGAVVPPSYEDLRNSVSIQRPEETYQPKLQMQQNQPQPQLQLQPQQQYQYEPQQYYDHSPKPTYEYEYPRYSPSVAPMQHQKRKKKRPTFLSIDTLKRKDVWLLAAIMYAIVAYGLPRIRATFPSVVDPITGATSTSALVSLSILSALVFTFVNDTF